MQVDVRVIHVDVRMMHVNAIRTGSIHLFWCDISWCDESWCAPHGIHAFFFPRKQFCKIGRARNHFWQSLSHLPPLLETHWCIHDISRCDGHMIHLNVIVPASWCAWHTTRHILCASTRQKDSTKYCIRPTDLDRGLILYLWTTCRMLGKALFLRLLTSLWIHPLHRWWVEVFSTCGVPNSGIHACKDIDLCMPVSIYPYIYVSMYLCIYVSMYLYVYVSMYLCIYVSIYAGKQIGRYARMQA